MKADDREMLTNGPNRFIQVAIVVLFLLVGTPILIEFQRSHSYDPRTTLRIEGLSNVHQLGLATAAYLTDNDNVFPPDMSSAHAAVRYIRRYSHGPLYTTSGERDSSEFLGVGRLAGTNALMLPSAESQLEFFASVLDYKGTRASVSVLGTAKLLKEADFQSIVADDWIIPPHITAHPPSRNRPPKQEWQ